MELERPLYKLRWLYILYELKGWGGGASLPGNRATLATGISLYYAQNLNLS